MMIKKSSVVKKTDRGAAAPGSVVRRSRQAVPGHVLKQLREYILDRQLMPGDRLPTERELAQTLGVSRNSVREALTSLEAVGAVSRRPKIGCILQPVDLGTLAEITQFQLLRNEQDLAQLFIARRVLEESIIPLVVANATEQDIAQLRQTLADLQDQHERGEQVHDSDVAFHRALFAAAHNKFLYQFGSLIQVFFSESRRKIRAGVDRENRTLKEHRAIVDAIERRDEKAARQHLHDHLEAYVRSGTIKLA